MFGRSSSFSDPDLGVFERSRGSWRGRIELPPFGATGLVVPGSRSEPDVEALTLARSAADQFDRCRAQIEAALVEHREPYDGGQAIATSLRPGYVAVIGLDRRLVLEFGYQVPWDDDHTLGARVHDGRLIELCGSVLEP